MSRVPQRRSARPVYQQLAAGALLLSSLAHSEEPQPLQDPGQTGIPAAEAAAVATEPLAAPATGSPALASDAAVLQRRDTAQEQFLRLVDEKRYDEALTIATQIVDLTTQAYGAKSIELAAPLDNLATVQMYRGDFVAAESNYQASVGLIERTEGILSPRLINPLIGLGATYNRTGLYQQAMEAYQRALRVNHAQAGFYNPDQFKIRDGMSETYLAMDKIEEANFQQQTQVTIQRRQLGADSPELVPAFHKLARWYDRTGQFPEARLIYQATRRLIRETKGPRDMAIVDSLMGEAHTFEKEGLLPSSVSSLKEALEIIDAQPQSDYLKRAEVLVALGDLYSAFNKVASARERYTQAWLDLSREEDFREKRDEYFAQPTRIAGQLLNRVTVGRQSKSLDPRTRPEAFAEGYVVASLEVDEEGRVREPKVVESEPPGLMDAYVLDILQSSRFRPHYEGGQPLRTDGVLFRHEFKYLRTLAKAAEPASGDESPAGEQGTPIAYPGEPADAGGEEATAVE